VTASGAPWCEVAANSAMRASETMRSEDDRLAAEQVLELSAEALDGYRPLTVQAGCGRKVGTLDPAQLAPAAATMKL